MQDFFKDCFCNRETFFKFVRKNKCVKRIVYFLIFILAISAFSCGKSKEKVITIEKDLKIIPFGRFSRAFNDMNDRHLEAVVWEFLRHRPGKRLCQEIRIYAR